MDEKFFQISFEKVMKLVLQEERQKIRNFYMKALGEATASQMDSYEVTESEVLKLFTEE
jgi:hypothetical protein